MDFDDDDLRNDEPEIVKPAAADLSAFSIDPAAIQQLVVDQAAEALVRRIGASDDLRYAVQKAAARMIEQKVQEAVLPVLEEMVTGLSMTPTNEWGEKKGEPMTLREFAANTVLASMNELVDYHGNPTKGTYNQNNGKRRYVFIVEQMCAAEVKNEVAKAAKLLKDNVGQAFGELVKAALNEQLKLITGNR